MSSGSPSTTHPPVLLTSVLGLSGPSPTLKSDDLSRPFVTLTFAQSLDGKIAGRGGKQLILSGKESMLMTHWMRTMHDAILIGIGTALNDNPQLNTRHLPPRAATEGRYHLPRPVILDSHCRLKADCKLLNNYNAGVGRRPWIICSPAAPTLNREALERAGAKIIETEETDGKICIPTLLKVLKDLDVQSVMVEGGASIIASFLAQAHPAIGSLDAIIVTVAPVFVGDDGTGYGIGLSGDQIPQLQHVRTELMGQDTVVAVKPR
ncbi:bacterial bifunctional deaminase-reductase [Athelia psychrophila]|uniref:2,5-diamino-6-ribosylamino-4(3H)-pyrimidinone 5'-phosphate reductase n=1 Tax=Athelia psychrophila TaxID=1759441 RepID=A0A166RYH8_9AGAM|nr:bacterial bifunctional deaminase-reductase [Fibularhizoctonia sp. CBS 109695]